MNTISFKETHSRAIRIWHWLTFIVVTILFITVIIAGTFLDGSNTASTIHDKLAKNGVTLTREQAMAASSELRENVWDWHTYFGVALSALFLFRIILEFFQPQNEKLSYRIRKSLGFLRSGVDIKNSRHYLLTKVIYVVFYIILIIMVGTGLWLTFSEDDGPNPLNHSIKEVHEFCMYLVLGFIVIHLAGVIRAEGKQYKGITSDMINGGREI